MADLTQDKWYNDAYRAGHDWCRKRIKTAKGTFTTDSGLLNYMKTLGMEATLDMSLTGASSAQLERYGNAKQARAGFLDGADSAWWEYRNRP